MRDYHYILWDLDGTITNSFEGVSNCVRHALAHFGVELEDELLRRFIGPPLRTSFPQYAGLNEEETALAVELYRERYNPIGVFECALYPGVRETMETLARTGHKQILASSKPEVRCRDILEMFSLTSYLDEIVGASMDGRIDTKGQVLQEVFRRLRLADPDFVREEVVLIGDTKYDADGAREAGIDCIGVTYGFGSRRELVEHGCVGVFDSLSEVTDYLCRDKIETASK